MTYTPEQQNVINSTSTNISVNAGPGMGKTHLLLGIAEKYKEQQNGLLCFNSPIRKEILEKAKKRKIETMEINTFHSLAFNSLKRRADINNFINRDFNNPLDYFSLLDIMKKLEFKDISSQNINNLLLEIKHFCMSDKNLKIFLENNDKKEEILKILTYIIKDPKAPMFHEIYIKVYQIILLKQPIKKYDCLMVDEFQDVSPCYLSIIENINKNKIVRVGDTLQKIYGYNGALGMDEHNFALTKSFRIGKGTSDLCNKLISMFIGDESLYINGVNQNQIFSDIEENEKKTIIFRTNKGLIKRLIEETRKNKICAVSDTLYEEIRHIYKLLNCNTFFSYTFRGIKFTKREMIYEWYEKSKNKTLKRAIEFLEEYKEDSKIILYEILKHLTTDENEADIFFTTTHRSKGLEFENVEIASDFPSINCLLKKKQEGDDYIDEIYIIYVAITRSFGKLQLNEDLKRLIRG